jgi:hypothetical protein
MYKRPIMKRPLALLLTALAALPAFADTAPDADQILAAADRVRNPDAPFRLSNSLVEYVGGQARDRVTLTVYARLDQTTKQFGSLVRYVDPPRDQGKMVLFNGTNMWFYDPASKSSVRISPQQRLLGQASNGDVVTVNLSRDYKAALTGEEHLQDADRQDRDCWHLDMKAATPDAIYARIEYWVDRANSRPVKGKFYADSGRLLKIAYYHRYAEQLGAQRPTETIIIDAVDPNLVTTMGTTDYRYQEIPDAWFQRDYLPRVPAD